MKEVFVIGDSISIQYGPCLKKLLDGVFRYDRKRGLDQALADLDKPTGANGGDSAMVLAYMKELESEGRKLDILLFNCGLHDMKTDPATGEKQVPLDKYRANLDEIATLAKKLSERCFWIRTTDAQEHIHNDPPRSFFRYHADVVAYNQAADEIMAAHGIPTIDLYGFTRTFGDDAFCDHVHYKEDIRALQAAFLYGYLHAALRPPLG